MAGRTVTAEVEISAPPDRVWDALTDPQTIQQYFFGSRVETTWEPGTPITWSGEYGGHAYQDHGEVLEVVPEQRLVVTHFSPLAGQPDVPENHHRISYRLEAGDDGTRLTLEQDNTPDESVEDFRANWQSMLERLRQVVEGR